MKKRGPKPTYKSMQHRLLANMREDSKGCWVWQLRTTVDGYPLVNYREDGKHKTARAHRVMFELVAGRTIPEGFEMDHACFNRRCIRPGPGHCMPVTKQENLANRRRYASSHVCTPNGF